MDYKAILAQHLPTFAVMGQVIKTKVQEGGFIAEILSQVVSAVIASTIVLGVGGYITIQVLDSKLADLDQRTMQNRLASETRDTDLNNRLTHDEDIHRLDLQAEDTKLNDMRKELYQELRDEIKSYIKR